MLVFTIFLELCTSYSCSCHHLHHLFSNRIQNGGILVSAHPCCLGKRPLKECCLMLLAPLKLRPYGAIEIQLLLLFKWTFPVYFYTACPKAELKQLWAVETTSEIIDHPSSSNCHCALCQCVCVLYMWNLWTSFHLCCHYCCCFRIVLNHLFFYRSLQVILGPPKVSRW